MYRISDQQIDYILNDFRARGVEMESLQENLLDHICCIIEQELEANGDFERFYSTTIKTFYKNELKEIEEETISLLNNKNYYTMKKVMLTSGIISALLLTMGIVLKFLHAPGASFGIVIGITLLSFVFLPLMFTLKIKEKTHSKDKLLLVLGSLVAILISMATLFKLQHWPYANMMGMVAVSILILAYLPINLMTGIRNPATKANTIVSSILLVAGCGLFLSLARSPQGSKLQYIKDTGYFVKNEQLYKNGLSQRDKVAATSKIPAALGSQSQQILMLCDEIKSLIIEKETGLKSIDENFESQNAWLGETYSKQFFEEGNELQNKYISLAKLIKDYNAAAQNYSHTGIRNIPFKATLIEPGEQNERVLGTLNNLIQVELYVLQNELAFAFSN
ncbi:MAG: hypothetical protein IPP71_09350 [Bacteroidetes bacterium]|nr:hypothetical protein [Bacteroidota bacterium]